MLKVNIWTPSLTGKRPVMFYIHGGGFTFGSAYELASQDGAQMAEAWATFARTGNPSQPGLAWEPFNPTRCQTMVFDNNCRMVDDPEAEVRRRREPSPGRCRDLKELTPVHHGLQRIHVFAALLLPYSRELRSGVEDPESAKTCLSAKYWLKNRDWGSFRGLIFL